MADVMEGAPYESRDGFEDALVGTLIPSLCSVMDVDTYFADYITEQFLKDVEEALKFDADHGGDVMSAYYNDGRTASSGIRAGLPARR